MMFNSNLVQVTKEKIPPSKHERVAAVGRRIGKWRKGERFLNWKREALNENP